MIITIILLNLQKIYHNLGNYEIFIKDFKRFSSFIYGVDGAQFLLFSYFCLMGFWKSTLWKFGFLPSPKETINFIFMINEPK